MKSFMEHVRLSLWAGAMHQHLLQSSRWRFGKGVSLAWRRVGMSSESTAELSGGVLQGSEEPRWSRQKEEGAEQSWECDRIGLVPGR